MLLYSYQFDRRDIHMKPLQISPDTAVKLAAKLKVPLEHLMHMPQHILLQKIAELAKEEAGSKPAEAGAEPSASEAAGETKPGDPQQSS